MRLLSKCLSTVVLVAFLGVAGHAQIIGDSEGPEPSGGDGADLPVPCVTCCNMVPVDPTCAFYCGCQTPNICPNFIALQSPSVQVGSIAQIYRSIAETRTKMTQTSRGMALLSEWETYAERVARIYRQRPALAQRVGEALVEYWPADVAGGSDVVERDALLELRAILRQIARADAQADSDGLANVIRSQVLPRLDDNLIGRSTADAFQCFISDEGC